MSYTPTIARLSDGETALQRLIVCIAEAYEDTTFTEVTTNNSDAFIGDLWDCYHPYGNYGAYCIVGATVILNGASKLANTQGNAQCRERLVPWTPNRAVSTNTEGTLYGNVYDTLQELLLSDRARVTNTPKVGSLFMRPGDSGKNNHAGIVISAPLGNDLYIETIEANVSTSGYGGSRKGFQRVQYTKAGYDDFAGRDWIRSARAPKFYNDHVPTGWYFFHAWELCQASDALYSGELCLGVTVTCDQRSTTPTTTSKTPTTTTQPVPLDCQGPPPPPDEGYTQWRSVAELIEEISRTTVDGISTTTTKKGTTSTTLPVTTKYPSAGREFTTDGCWVRWRTSEIPADTAKQINRGDTKCPDGLILNSCCEGGATTISFPSKTQMLSLDDLRSEGGRQALMTTAIDDTLFAQRGFEQRHVQAGQMWPMVRLSNGQSVSVVVKGSLEYKIGTELGLFGPNPAYIEFDRTEFDLGTGAGWAERISAGFNPDGHLEATDGFIVKDDLGVVSAGSWVKGNPLIGEKVYGVSFFRILEALENNPDKWRGRQPVIVLGGEPTTVLSVVAGLSQYIGAAVNIVLPGVGSILSGALSIAQNAYQRGSLDIVDAFSFLGYLGSGLSNVASNNNDGKLFGVDGKVFGDITRYASTSNNIYGILNSKSTGVQASMAILMELQANVPELTDLAREQFADEEKWIRGAFAEINQQVGGVLNDVRMAINNVSDGVATSIIGNLSMLDAGVDSVFANLLASEGSGINKSSAKVPIIQDLLTGAPHPSLLNTRAGTQDLFARILSLPATFATDVTDGAVHSAIASVVSGKRIVDGALDQLTLDSLLHKAETFARNKWKFDVPPTIPEDKRECFQREVAICIGTECCPPLVMTGGTCAPRTSTTNTAKKPSGIQENASCLRTVNGEMMWCRPAECDGGDDRYETATITLRSEAGTPYDVIATRLRATTEWTDFRVLVYEPVYGTSEYRKPSTVPVDLVTAGVSIASDDFEAVRRDQSSPIMEAIAPQTTATPTGTDGCTAMHPARLSADGSERVLVNIGGVWQVLVGCCPETYVPQAQGGGDGCCTEVSVLGTKIDQLASAIEMLTSQWKNQPTTTTTTTSGARSVELSFNQPAYELPPGVPPLRPCCDLNPILALLEELPSHITNVETMDSSSVPVDLGQILNLGTSPRTPVDASNITTLQTALDRIESAIGKISPGSPCDNSDVLTKLVEMQARMERATIAYDDTVLQRKLDLILESLPATATTTNADAVLDRLIALETLIRSQTTTGGSCDLTAVLEAIKNIQIPSCTTLDAESIIVMLTRVSDALATADTKQTQESDRVIREIKEYIDARMTVTNTATNTASATNLERVISELSTVRTQYESVMSELRTFIESNVTVCDTATLRSELTKQTDSIRELRTLVEQGVVVDTSAIERELLSQRELLQVIVERISTNTVVTSSGDVTDKQVVTTIVKCDDQELKTALSELREMVRLIPVVQEELRDLKTVMERQYAELRSEIAIATQILRDLQSRQTTTTTPNFGTTTNTDTERIIREVQAQRQEVLTLIERYSQVAPTCDLSEMKVMLVALQTAQAENSSNIARILERLNTAPTNNGTTTVCDTTTIREAVREAMSERMDRYEATLQRLTELVTNGTAVREVTVNVDSLERKLDEVIDRLRSMQSYDNTELLQRINDLATRPTRDDTAILRKLDLLIGQTNNTTERTTLEAVRNDVQTRTATGRTNIEEPCVDCPAFVEEHRKVFYRYPTTTETNATAQATAQAQAQASTATQASSWGSSQPQVEIVPITMPCHNC